MSSCHVVKLPPPVDQLPPFLLHLQLTLHWSKHFAKSPFFSRIEEERGRTRRAMKTARLENMSSVVAGRWRKRAAGGEGGRGRE